MKYGIFDYNSLDKSNFKIDVAAVSLMHHTELNKYIIYTPISVAELLHLFSVWPAGVVCSWTQHRPSSCWSISTAWSACPPPSLRYMSRNGMKMASSTWSMPRRRLSAAKLYSDPIWEKRLRDARGTGLQLNVQVSLIIFFLSSFSPAITKLTLLSLSRYDASVQTTALLYPLARPP